MSDSTSHLFERCIEEVLCRLIGDESREAARLLVEADDLIQIFRKWREIAPAVEEKNASINRLFALYQDTIWHILNKKK